MEEKKRPMDEEYSNDGDHEVHHPSGTRVRIGDDGVAGVPIDWNDDGGDDYSQADVVEKAVEISKRRRGH